VANVTLLARNLGKHMDLSTSIYNLLDKKYFDAPSTENLQQAIQQDGRSFRVKMTWRWGER
jgi:iron complex outermembrane receptor protein